MICPKCRTKYPEGVSVCPDCGIDLIALLGEADAPADEEWDLKKSRWKSAPEDDMIIPQTVEIYSDRSAECFEEEEPITQEEPAEKQPDITLEEKDFSAFERKPAKKLEEFVVNEDDDFSPVVYKKSQTQTASKSGGNAAGLFLLVLSILFMAVSAVMFYMGRKPSPAPDAEITSTVSAVISAFFTF